MIVAWTPSSPAIAMAMCLHAGGQAAPPRVCRAWSTRIAAGGLRTSLPQSFKQPRSLCPRRAKIHHRRKVTSASLAVATSKSALATEPVEGASLKAASYLTKLILADPTLMWRLSVALVFLVASKVGMPRRMRFVNFVHKALYLH